jgi:CBS-domain-containing membrane protein
VSPRELTGQQMTLEDVLRPAISVRHATPAREALQVMLDNNVPGVPVVDEEGNLVGFVSDGHLLASALPEYLKVMADVSFVSEAGDEWVDYFAGRPIDRWARS